MIKHTLLLTCLLLTSCALPEGRRQVMYHGVVSSLDYEAGNVIVALRPGGAFPFPADLFPADIEPGDLVSITVLVDK